MAGRRTRKRGYAKASEGYVNPDAPTLVCATATTPSRRREARVTGTTPLGGPLDSWSHPAPGSRAVQGTYVPGYPRCMTRLVLASASPARATTLRAAGIVPLVRVSDVDEPAVLAQARERFGALEPEDAVLVLAQAKAEDVARAVERAAADAEHDDGASDFAGRHVAPLDADDALVLGCDSMLEIDGDVLGKPADAAEAVARWQQMRGRSATLHTGHWIVDLRDPEAGGTGATLGATSSTVVHFADVSDAEVEAYVATGEPLHVAGAFTIDGLGGPFVRGVEGDHHAVVGLSLPLLRELLGELGLTVVELWER